MLSIISFFCGVIVTLMIIYSAIPNIKKIILLKKQINEFEESEKNILRIVRNKNEM